MKVLRLNEGSRRRQNLQLEQLQDIFPAPSGKNHRARQERPSTSPAALLAARTYVRFHLLVCVFLMVEPTRSGGAGIAC